MYLDVYPVCICMESDTSQQQKPLNSQKPHCIQSYSPPSQPSTDSRPSCNMPVLGTTLSLTRHAMQQDGWCVIGRIRKREKWREIQREQTKIPEQKCRSAFFLLQVSHACEHQRQCTVYQPHFELIPVVNNSYLSNTQL